MGIDTSIYSKLSPIPVNVPSPVDMAEKSMTLSNMGLQQMQQQMQMQQNMAMRKAYADNTDPTTGQVNKGGVLSSLGKMGMGHMVPGMAADFAKQDKDAADAKSVQIANAQKMTEAFGPGYEYIAGQKPENRAAAYRTQLQQWADQGLDTSKFPKDYDPNLFRQAYGNYTNTKGFLDNMKSKAEAEKTIAETGKVPYEIAKIKSDMGNIQINRMTDYQKMLNSDEQYKKAGDVIASGKSASNLIEAAKTNAVAKSQLPFAIATMMNNGQPIRNAKEMDSFFENLPPGDKTRELLSNLTTGKLDEDLAGKLQDLIANKIGSATEDRSARSLDVAKQYSAATGMPIEEAHFKLTNKLPNAQSGQSSAVAGRQGDSERGGGAPGVKSAQAAGKPTTKAEDSAAINWAKSNMKNPKAQAILKYHGLL